MKYAFYPGCKIAFKCPDLEYAIREVLATLGIPFEYLENFSCCPTWPSVPSFDIEAWLPITARNISLAEEKGLDIVVGCGNCYSVLNHAREMLRDETLREKTNRILSKIGRVYRGSAKVYHLIHIIDEKKVRKNLKLNLDGFRVAIQPGCHLLWPSRIMDIKEENPFRPLKLKKLVEALGAEAPYYSRIEFCCGYNMDVVDYEKSLEFLYVKLKSIKEEVNPDMIVTACSSCFIQLDEGQKKLKKMGKIDFEIPVFHYPQLLAICFGHDPSKVARISSVSRDEIIKRITRGEG